MKGWIVAFSVLFLCQSLSADMPSSTRGTGSISLSVDKAQRVVVLFREIARLSKAPSEDGTANTTCGYIFPGDGNKFGCTGTGKAAKDVAAACQGGGSLACTGSGSSRTCTCAFD